MAFILKPRHLFSFILSGIINNEQQRIIAFQNAQIRVLMDLQGRKRLLLNDQQRRLLAVKGKVIGRRALLKLTTIVTPDTILRWHRKLIANKWDYSDRNNNPTGRPKTAEVIKDLILSMNRENPSWGYTRIQGALKNLGYDVSPTTVANILKDHGIEPIPLKEQKMPWKTFLKATGVSLLPLTSPPWKSGQGKDW